MKKRVIALIVLIFIVLLEAILLAHCSRQRAQEAAAPKEPQATQSPELHIVTPAPEQPAELTPSPAPAPTAEPTPTPAPSPTPTAEPTPSPTPEPTATPSYGTVIAQGTFSSDTGTAMNMNIEWVAYDNGSGNAVIAVTGTVTSYSLQLTDIWQGAQIEFAEYSAAADTRSIFLEGDDRVESPLFYTTLTVPRGTAGDMTVTWRYGGSYSGVTLDTVTATGYVQG